MFKSFDKVFGDIPKTAVAIEGSTKCYVSLVLVITLLLKFGFHDGKPFIIYKFLNFSM